MVVSAVDLPARPVRSAADGTAVTDGAAAGSMDVDLATAAATTATVIPALDTVTAIPASDTGWAWDWVMAWAVTDTAATAGMAAVDTVTAAAGMVAAAAPDIATPANAVATATALYPT